MQIKPGQKLVLIKLCQRIIGDDREARLYLISHLLDKEVESFNNLTVSDWQRIRDKAFPNWPDNDWTISKEFDAEALQIARQYQIEILGQLLMFPEIL